MPPENPDNKDVDSRPKWRRELLIALGALGVGLVLMPLAVYGVGVALLGPYSGGPHIGSFLGDYFRNLGSGSIRTWFLVVSPYVAILLLRAVFRRWQRPRSSEDFREPPAIADVPMPSAPKSSPLRNTAASPSGSPSGGKAPRREPFVSP